MALIYYVEGEEQHGPIGLSELEALKQSGTVEDGTLVWQDGMEDWIPFADAFPLLKGEASAERTGAGAVAVAAAVTAAVPATATDEANPFLAAAKSGAGFSPNDMAGPAVPGLEDPAMPADKPGTIRPANAFEATMAARMPDPAGLGGRTAAYVIDSIVIAIGFIAVTVLTMTLFQNDDLSVIVAIVLGMVWMVAYDANLWGAEPCRTVGKRLMGMRVEKADGTALTSGGAIGRTLIKLMMLSVVSPLICFIIVLCDSRKRSVQDFALGTVVVNEFS